MTDIGNTWDVRRRAFMRLFMVAIYVAAGGVIFFALSRVRSGQAPDYRALASWQYAFLAILGLAAVAVISLKKYARGIWEVAFTLALFLGVWYLLLFTLPLGVALAIASILTLAHLALRTVVLHDLFYIIGGAGVAVDFAGWFTPELLIVGLVGFSIYDIVAGPPGGPIETLAKSLVSKGIIPGLVIISEPKDLLRRVEDVLPRSALLGAGDLILPMCLVASAAMKDAMSVLPVLFGIVVASALVARRDPEHPRAVLPALAAGAAVPFVILRLLGAV